MDAVLPALIVISLFLAFDLAAIRFGVDSRDH